MIPQSAIFLFVLVIAAGFFALNVQRLTAYLNFGVPENRTDHPLTRIKNVLTIGIAQKKIFRDPVAGPMHALVSITPQERQYVVQGALSRIASGRSSLEPVQKVNQILSQ